MDTTLLKQYFAEYPLALSDIHINSFDHFLKQVPTFLENQTLHIVQKSTEYKVRFTNVQIKMSEEKNGKQLLPSTARRTSRTYSSKILCDVVVLDGNNKSTRIKKIVLCDIPMMIKSKYTRSNNNTTHGNQEECPYDIGGYFIIKGIERVIVPQLQYMHNKILVSYHKGIYTSYIFSRNDISQRFVKISKVKSRFFIESTLIRKINLLDFIILLCDIERVNISYVKKTFSEISNTLYVRLVEKTMHMNMSKYTSNLYLESKQTKKEWTELIKTMFPHFQVNTRKHGERCFISCASCF